MWVELIFCLRIVCLALGKRHKRNQERLFLTAAAGMKKNKKTTCLENEFLYNHLPLW